MFTPGSCTVCSRPLLPSSVGGMCVECLRRTGEHETTADTGPLDIVYRAPVRPQEPPPPAPDPTARPDLPTRTGPFDPNATTAEPPPRRLPESPPGYVLIRELGGGGMGYVYLAREVATERLVAVKFLHNPGSAAAFERFLVEVRALAALDHPHIVRVLHVELNWREPFFTMEYIPGGTLADLAGPGTPPVDPREAARLVMLAAEAVAAAHGKGVIHRDLKPSNILLQIADLGLEIEDSEAGGSGLQSSIFNLQSSIPKVSDFGLAKETDRGEDLTRTGPIGTPGYMSPEAAAGRFREVRERADVYGLGATLFYLLTGMAPFRGKTKQETLERVQRDAPARVRGVRPAVPAELEAVVVKALEKEPARRYASAAALAADLRRFLAGEPTEAPVLSGRRRAVRWLGRNRRRLAAAAGLVLVAAGLVAAGRALTPPQEVEVKRAVLAGDAGPPGSFDWVHGPTAFGHCPCAGGGFSFETLDHAVLELARDPGADRYSVSAEILIVRTEKDSVAGLYFGRVTAATRAGQQTHTFLAATFDDFAPDWRPPGETDGSAQLRISQLVELPLESPINPTGGMGPVVRFPPVPRRPGQWRRVRVEVTPDEVRAFWRPADGQPEQSLGTLTTEQVEEAYAKMLAKLDAGPAGAGAAPRWQPRLGIGVWCRAGRVCVRNVVVEPLPPPSTRPRV